MQRLRAGEESHAWGLRQNSTEGAAGLNVTAAGEPQKSLNLQPTLFRTCTTRKYRSLLYRSPEDSIRVAQEMRTELRTPESVRGESFTGTVEGLTRADVSNVGLI